MYCKCTLRLIHHTYRILSEIQGCGISSPKVTQISSRNKTPGGEGFPLLSQLQ